MFYILDVFFEVVVVFEVDGEKIGELYVEFGFFSRDEEGRSFILSFFSRVEVLIFELLEFRFFIFECWMRLIELLGIFGL